MSEDSDKNEREILNSWLISKVPSATKEDIDKATELLLADATANVAIKEVLGWLGKELSMTSIEAVKQDRFLNNKPHIYRKGLTSISPAKILDRVINLELARMGNLETPKPYVSKRVLESNIKAVLMPNESSSEKGEKIQQRIFEKTQPEKIKTPTDKVVESLAKKFEEKKEEENKSFAPMHMTSWNGKKYNYVGPWTKITDKIEGKQTPGSDGTHPYDIPINALDWAAMLHDIAYTSKDEDIRAIADIRFLKSVDKEYGKGLVNDADLVWASTWVNLKNLADRSDGFSLGTSTVLDTLLQTYTARATGIVTLPVLAAIKALFHEPFAEEPIISRLSSDSKKELAEIEVAQDAMVLNLEVQGYKLNEETGEIDFTEPQGNPEEIAEQIEKFRKYAEQTYSAISDNKPTLPKEIEKPEVKEPEPEVKDPEVEDSEVKTDPEVEVDPDPEVKTDPEVEDPAPAGVTESEITPQLAPTMTIEGASDLKLTEEQDSVNENRLMNEIVMANTEYMDTRTKNPLKIHTYVDEAVRYYESDMLAPTNDAMRNPQINNIGFFPGTENMAKKSLSYRKSIKKIKLAYRQGRKKDIYTGCDRFASRLGSSKSFGKVGEHWETVPFTQNFVSAGIYG